MLDQVQAGAFDIVVAESLDRLSRDLEEVARVRRQMIWDSRRADLGEAPAHLVGHFMQQLCGVASGGVRWSFV